MLSLRSLALWKVSSRCSGQACSSNNTGVRLKSIWIKKQFFDPPAENDDANSDSPFFELDKGDNIEKAFTHPRVQNLLKMLLGSVNLEKVYTERVVHISERKHYALMNDGMIKYFHNNMEKRAQRYLAWVPFKKPRSNEPVILSKDPELNHHDESNFVFSDISYDASRRDRLVVVREPNGNLRQAFPEEHDRMDRVYYPTEDRPVKEPALFSGPDLADGLRRKNYEYILDFASTILEPDDPRFAEISTTVFDHAARSVEGMDALQSTRHFPTMIFYLAVNRKAVPLLNYFARKKSLPNMANVIRLIKILNPQANIDLPPEASWEAVVQAFLERYDDDEHMVRKLRPVFSFLKELEEERKKPKEDREAENS